MDSRKRKLPIGIDDFFEVGMDRHLFDGLIISADAELCEEWMGQYPVISLLLLSKPYRESEPGQVTGRGRRNTWENM
ncbi:MAG: hypothetical protein LUF32_09925 [Clostridiales bacterium]|nr:hypothetical protein [Clostridiales bacterium]